MSISALAILAAAHVLAAPPALDQSSRQYRIETAPRTAPYSPAIDTSFLNDATPNDINGRLYVGQIIMGGDSSSVRTTIASNAFDDAARYGAAGAGNETIIVAAEGLFPFQRAHFAEIRPFTPVDAGITSPYSNSYTTAQKKLASRLESARQQWLKDNNFTGGVRTFVNDSTLVNPTSDQKTQVTSFPPEPSAVIELSPDTPRFKSKMRVLAPNQTLPTTTATTMPSVSSPAAASRSIKSASAYKVAPRVTKVLPRTEPLSPLDNAQVQSSANAAEETNESSGPASNAG